MPPPLTTRSHAALEALCRRIVPAAFETAPPIDVIAAVERRIEGLEPALRAELIGALHFFDHPITGMLLSGRPRRFSTLPDEEQDALLHEWERSPLALRRTVFQALRRLILSTWYGMPESHAEIGYLGPLHLREPMFSWEGPALPPPLSVAESAGAGTPEADERPTHAGDDVPVALHDVALRRSAPPWPSGVIRGDSLPADHRLRTDVCIIGSGAGGAVMAARLAEAGLQVLVLEEGPFLSGADFDDDEARLGPLLYADGGARATDDLSILLLQGRCVGGGTTINWMMTLRPQPWVLDEWEREHRIELLAADRLLPALDLVEQEINARPLPDHAHSPANRVILDGCQALGWRTLDARINARGCVRSGACSLGCRWGAKQSAGEVFLPRALRAGATLCCGVRADGIRVMERNGATPLKRVTATVVDAGTGTPRGTLTVDAPLVVLAAGAVGTPALLERSGIGTPAVGRWLRLHPTTGVFGYFDRPIYGAAGVPQSAACAEFLHGDDGYGFWIETAPLRPGLTAAALQGFGDGHRRRMREFPNNAPLIVLVRDGAERSRSSGDVRVDRRGRIRIRYRMSESDRGRMAVGARAAARLHLAAGARSAETLHVDAAPLRNDADIARLTSRRFAPNRVSLFSAHVNGTCRMGRDTRTSGCTPEGELHGQRGIFVADGSLFPTAPGVNPQAAILALSSLVSERVRDRLR